MPKGYMYILECADGSFYTGSTIDLQKRLFEHQSGQGAKHTKNRLPVMLVYYEEFQEIHQAFYREKQIQGWSRAKKIALIQKNYKTLPKLSECKNETHYKNQKDNELAKTMKKKTNLKIAERNKILTERNLKVAERSRLVAERSRSYSNGKLLLTGEYLVLDGAKALAVPTKFGQDLVIEPIKEAQLIWASFTNENSCWFEASFDLPKLRLTSATFNSDKEGSAEFIAETLLKILQEAQKLNPDFLKTKNGFIVKTHLTFPQNWGLGSSSTLINNIASWANVNPFTLLWNAFSGSGYDIACAKNDSPIFYQLAASTSLSHQSTSLSHQSTSLNCQDGTTTQNPIIEKVDFHPSFADELFFIHLNKKQNSREGINRYRKKRKNIQKEIDKISQLSNEFIRAQSSSDLNKIITEHEQIISSIIKLEPVKTKLFNDYFGEVKSLGAWGGDFVLATGNKDSQKYFNNKGYKTIIPYKKMIL